jgi:hypothetical protein
MEEPLCELDDDAVGARPGPVLGNRLHPDRSAAARARAGNVAPKPSECLPVAVLQDAICLPS